MTIPISIDEIREMVKNVISEVHGAIDDKLFGLCNIIFSRLRGGEKDFTIDRATLQQFYPYKNCPDSLNVSLTDLPTGRNAYMAYAPDSNTIKIDPVSFCFTPQRRNAYLIHELTHFVNNMEKTKRTDADNLHFDVETDNEEYAREIIYFFEPSEMQARASQFKQELKANPNQPLEYYNNTTQLRGMRNLIEFVKNDKFLGASSTEFSIIDLLLAQRAYKRWFVDTPEKKEKGRFLNITTEQDHERAKAAIVKKLQRRYNKFFTVISKIYYDSISSAKKLLKEQSNNLEKWYRGYNSKYGSDRTALIWLTSKEEARMYGNRVEEVVIDKNKVNDIDIDDLYYDFLVPEFGYEDVDDYQDEGTWYPEEGLDERESDLLRRNGYNCYYFITNDAECICMWDKSPIVSRRELSREEFEAIEKSSCAPEPYKEYDDIYDISKKP